MLSKKLSYLILDDTIPAMDTARLRRERLKKLQEQMRKAACESLILFDPVNIRYATGTRLEDIWSLHHFVRYAVVPVSGEPALFELAPAVWWTARVCKNVRAARTWQFMFAGSRKIERANAWAKEISKTLKEMGVHHEKVGIDKLDLLGFQALTKQHLNLVDAQEIVERARIIKTRDEIELLKLSCSVADHALHNIKNALEPGVRELDLFAILSETTIKDGGEYLNTRLVLSGGNTNPWLGESSAKMVRNGDLVGIDTDMTGPAGYFNCISRTYLCGSRPTEEQKEMHKFCYEFIYSIINKIRPGLTFTEVADLGIPYPEKYKGQNYGIISHGCGLSEEYPSIVFNDIGKNENDKLKRDMVITVEAYVGALGGQEGVKLGEQVLITSRGCEVLSSAEYDEKLMD
jgi:Xaa-Pro aminopeptidase